MYFVLQVLVGIAAAEYVFQVTKKYRENDEARDSQYPAYRLNDGHKWSRPKLYVGAAMFLLPRVLLLFLLTSSTCFVIFLVTIVGNPNVGTFRKTLIQSVLTAFCTFFLLICGISTSLKDHKFIDYSKYLGSWYQRDKT